MALPSRDGWFFTFFSPLNQPRFPACSYRIRRGLSSLAIICALVVSCADCISKPLCLSAVVCLDVIDRLLVRVLAKQWRLVCLVNETSGVDTERSSGHDLSCRCQSIVLPAGDTNSGGRHYWEPATRFGRLTRRESIGDHTFSVDGDSLTVPLYFLP